MDGLKYLCNCCMKNHCIKNEIIEKFENGCKVVKCLQFTRDLSKIKGYEEYNYVCKSNKGKE